MHTATKAQLLAGWDLPGVPGSSCVDGRMPVDGVLPSLWKGEPQRNIQVFGLQNTGTNLLQAMLCLNFGSRLRHFDSIIRGDVEGVSWAPGLWKHSHLKAIQEIAPTDIARLRDEGVIPIMTVRNPFSWLASMRKAGYELTPCMQGPDWATRPCPHPIPGGYHSTVPGMMFSSIEEIWSVWVSAYEGADEFLPSPIIIDFETLVQEPAATMRHIAEALGIEPPEEVSVIEEAQGYDAHGQDEAIEKLRSRSYMQEYSAQEIQDVCARLDLTLASRHGYNECNEMISR